MRTIANGAEETAEVLVGADAQCVTPELATCRVGRDRVARVQREVGLFGTHLVAVMGEMRSAICHHRLK